MQRTLFSLSSFFLVALAACDDARVSVTIESARAYRAPDGRTIVDVEVRADEGLGENLGTYCAIATFDGQAEPTQYCNDDIEDGDLKTVRLLSDGPLAPGSAIGVVVRIAGVDVGRSLVAPP